VPSRDAALFPPCPDGAVAAAGPLPGGAHDPGAGIDMPLHEIVGAFVAEPDREIVAGHLVNIIERAAIRKNLGARADILGWFLAKRLKMADDLQAFQRSSENRDLEILKQEAAAFRPATR